MAQPRQNMNILAQQRIARKYKLLGYEVLENPEADRLPEFMRGVTPDIVAQSKSDNVVIEVKQHSSLKGSNDLIGIAQRVSDHPGWRFELVVLDEDEQMRSARPAMDHDSLLKKVQLATSARLPDMAYAYLTDVLVTVARDLAGQYNVKFKDKSDRSLFADLSFKGVLPEALAEECLSALSTRNNLLHRLDDNGTPSEADLQRLLRLCEQLKGLLQAF